jgi:hypothetical protein
VDVELAGVAVVVLLTVEDEEVGLPSLALVEVEEEVGFTVVEDAAEEAGLLAEELDVAVCLLALELVLLEGLTAAEGVDDDVRDVFTEEPEAEEGREVVVVEGRDVLVVEGREVVVAEGRA